jgi:uncharacterized protein (TIGR00255 family)
MSGRESVKSMTGYAQGRVEQDGYALRISVRAVNHRFLDLRLRVPEGFEEAETVIRKIVRNRVRRGHVDVVLQFEAAGRAAVGIRQEVAAAYLEAAEKLRKQFGLTAEPSVGDILRLPGVLAGPLEAQEHEGLGLRIEACMTEVLDRLDQMKLAEGKHLAEELGEHLQEIEEQAARMAGLLEKARPAFARRLQARLEELLGPGTIEPARLAQEVAIAAERSDASEELARLRSHLKQFETLLSAGVEAGKRLDFLLQEMQREANTLLSKTPGTANEGLEITRLGLEIKGEVEKLREQVQNLE